MNLLDLVTHLRKSVLYDTGGTGVDWSVINESDYDSIQLRWTNEELVNYINEVDDYSYLIHLPVEPKPPDPLPVISNLSTL